MLRLYHLLIGIALIVFIPVGVNLLRPRPPVQNRELSSTIPATPSQENRPVRANKWTSMLGNTGVPRGWKAIPCGNSSLLCVSANGKNLGSVAIETYPVSKQPDFQKMLVNAGISPNNPGDNQNPQYQKQVLKALHSRVNAEYRSLSQDYQKNHGDRIHFAAQPPEVVSFGKLEGIRYGFAGLKKGGRVVEKHLRYVAFDGESMYVINTAFTSDSLPSKFDRLENLVVFEPYLSAIAANLKLPATDSLATSQ